MTLDFYAPDDGAAIVDGLNRLAADLPPGAVVAHVVTDEFVPFSRRRRGVKPRAWVKVCDEPWRSVASVDIRAGQTIDIEWPNGDACCWPIATPSVTWDQSYGLRGRHEVMGVMG